ncbi:MAG: type II toxin-antitoxin system RelE/ParE family toxin [Acidobacteriaceae bacterium]|nr:type II toxin-antitoxin system RelE/ParE family toxin [Acidobacteriaceae bacterium]
MSSMPIVSISWEGDSWESLKSWPREMQHVFGVALREMQQGRRPTMDARPMQSIGKGVFELKDADDATWYRMLYLSRIDDVIYVLDCFTKNTRKTESNTLNKARSRLSQVRLRMQESKKEVKDGRGK